MSNNYKSPFLRSKFKPKSPITSAKYRRQAKALENEARQALATAKAEVERMILG